MKASRRPLALLQSLDDLEREAHKVLTPKAWIYYSSATETLSAHTGNLSAFAKVSLRPRILRNVARVSTNRIIMGHASDLPIFIAPAALARLGHPDGELCLVRGAVMANIPYCPSTYSSIAHEELVQELLELNDHAKKHENKPVVRGAIFPQLYPPLDKRQGLLKLIAQARRLGLKALVLTVDSAVIGKREEDERYKAQLDVDAGLLVDQEQGSPSHSNPLLPPDPTTEDERVVPRGAHSSTLCWEDLTWIRSAWDNHGPIFLKGLATVEDVAEAARQGVQGVYLSNHGGRQLDYAPSSLHTLLEIRKFRPDLFQKLEIYVDGGFRRGTDVVKALCLGATGVGMGRPFMFALSGYGTAGVRRALEILSDEIQSCMRLMGVKDIDQLDASYINPSLLELELQGVRPANMVLPGKL